MTVLALLLGMFASPALAASTISGTVTDADGTPLAGAQVSIGTVSGSTFTVASSTTTAANGTYSFAGTNGTFAVRYQSAVDAVAYWKSAGVATTDIAQAGTVSPSASADATASAPLFSRTIKGTVTTANGIPIPNVTVSVEKRVGTGAPFGYTAATTSPASVVTDGDGQYSLSVAQASNLVLGFTSSAYSTAYYKTSTTTTATKDDAAVVPFAAAGTPVTFNPKLALKQGSITGTVTRADAVSAPKLSGVTVELLTTAGTSFSPAVTDTTGANGVYSIEADPGSYKLKFTATGYDTEFYNNASSAGSAQTVAISGSAATSGIDAGLVRTAGPQVSGTVTNASGVPVSGVSVKLFTRTLSGSTGEISYDPVTTTPSVVTTAGDGTYSFDVAPGNYVVEFSAAAYRTVYFNGSAAGTTDRSAAQAVALAKGTGRDLSMTLTANGGAVFTGKVVTGSDNAAVSGVQVRVEYPTSNASGSTTYTVAATGTTASDGTYSVTAPTASGRQYVVGFYSSAFPTKYYVEPASGSITDGVTSRDGATRFPGTTQVSTTLKTLRLSQGAAVTGTVTDRSGSPLAGVDVTAIIYNTTTQAWVPANSYFTGGASVQTGNDGTYFLPLAAAGIDKPFRLEFSTTAREVRYFPDAISPDEGTNVQVSANQFAGGRDAVLPALAKLSGTVAYNDGSLFGEGGQVIALRRTTYRDAGENGGTRRSEYREIGRAPVNSSGGFTLSVPSSTFRLQYVNSSTGEEGFLPGLVGLDQAPDVTLNEAQTLSNQTYTLPTRQFIRGTVRDSLGTPRSGVTVEARYRYVVDIVDGVPVFSAWLGPVANNAARSVTTNDNGSYALPVYSRTYRVSASATVSGTTTTAYYSSNTTNINNATDVVLNGNDATGIDIALGTTAARNLQLPWVSGLNKVGQVLTANVGQWSPSDLTYTYLWQQNANPSNASGWANASGTNNGRTYTVPAAGGGIFGGGTLYAYRVIVTASRSGATAGTATSQATGVAVGSNATPDVENRRIPYITGTPAVGETLTSTGGDWSAAGTFTYQWYANGQVITGATGLTLTLTPDTVGKKVKFRVVETSGRTPSTGELVDSAETPTILPGVMRNTTRPSITGDARVAAVLTADPGTWNVASPSFDYQWFANGDAIEGATRRTYTLTAAEKGKRITVAVTARAASYTPGTASSASTAVVGDNTPTNTVKPSISGTPAVAAVLTADPGTWTPSGLAYAYQWFADGVAISGATAQTYKLTDAEFGKSITVRVTASTEGYVPASATSAAVGPVAAGQPVTVTGGPTVSGSARPNGVLTVAVGSYTPSDATVSVQWLRNGIAIPGATGTVYSVVADDVNQTITAQVTYARTGFVTTVRTSQGVAISDVPVRSAAKITVTKVVNGGKVKLVVNVTGANGNAAGQVKLTEGSRTYAVKSLRGGRVVFTVKGLKAGYHALTVKYLGSSTVKKGSKVVSVTIRK